MKNNNKISFLVFNLFLLFFFTNYSYANFKNNLINKLESTKTLSFSFVQTIGKNKESGNCIIKYPLLLKCHYPKKKKEIIADGKKLAIVKKRYKKIYYYPLNKTPLFYILQKKNIIYLINNYKPIKVDSNKVVYEYTEKNLSKLKIFFNKNSFNLEGWSTIDSYSNEVNFEIKNVETNTVVENNIFIIPKEEDL